MQVVLRNVVDYNDELLYTLGCLRCIWPKQNFPRQLPPQRLLEGCQINLLCNRLLKQPLLQQFRNTI